MPNIKFFGPLEKYDNNLWNYHIKVPDHIVQTLKEQKMTRFICSIDEKISFHASLMPAGQGIYFIKLNQERRKKAQLYLGGSMSVEIFPDDSKYGMPITEEFLELLLQDEEGAKYFELLTPGKQRSLLYLVNKLKSSQKRIAKSMIILDHLKELNGKLDFKKLHEDFKSKKIRIK